MVPEYDAAVEADDEAMEAIVNAPRTNDDRFFGDAANIIELANGDEREEARTVALLKNYLKQRRA